MRLPPYLLKTQILRGIVLWFVARLVGLAVLSLAGAPGGGAMLPAWVVAVSASLVHLDLHRRKELMLVNNLGVATAQAVVIGTIPALLFETMLLTW